MSNTIKNLHVLQSDLDYPAVYRLYEMSISYRP